MSRDDDHLVGGIPLSRAEQVFTKLYLGLIHDQDALDDLGRMSAAAGGLPA
ncbi:MAG: hypothetical protein VCE74_11220 [Alphaproteobacteria bacterium]